MIKQIRENEHQLIYDLIKNNYIEDNEKIIRIVHTIEHVKWYINNSIVSLGFIYNEQIIGFISASLINDLPYINLFVVDKKHRGNNLGMTLIEGMRAKLIEMNYNFALIVSPLNKFPNFAKVSEWAIPINYNRLHKIGFVDEINMIEHFQHNPLELLKPNDISETCCSLNSYLQKYKFKQLFTDTTFALNFISKKNIVLSFVIKNNNVISDFISVSLYRFFCIEHDKTINVAQLSMYFYSSNLTILVKYLLDKLNNYGIDQLLIKNIMENEQINLTKYETNNDLFLSIVNAQIINIDNHQIAINF